MLELEHPRSSPRAMAVDKSSRRAASREHYAAMIESPTRVVNRYPDIEGPLPASQKTQLSTPFIA